MGTTYHVKVVDTPDEIVAEALQFDIDEVLSEINRQMSTYDPDSELSRFNRSSSTDWVATSPGLAEVVDAALRISQLTEGAFDVTVGPLVNLWGFGPAPQTNGVPADRAVAEARARVGYQRIQVRTSPPAIRKDRADVDLDLSAIAKGYGVDQIAEYLEALGITNYLVEIGGELRGRGHNARGVDWTVAIEKPTPGERLVEQVIHIDSAAVATSGDYRNFFVADGLRYSHEIDPRTGRPVSHKLASVTVLTDTCMLADAWATALLVLGPKEGFEIAERQPLAAMFFTAANGSFEESKTSQFDAYVNQ
jgi:thiamine biosynthesis lipoprotein